jgi:hypothetical protein
MAIASFALAATPADASSAKSSSHAIHLVIRDRKETQFLVWETGESTPCGSSPSGQLCSKLTQHLNTIAARIAPVIGGDQVAGQQEWTVSDSALEVDVESRTSRIIQRIDNQINAVAHPLGASVELTVPISENVYSTSAQPANTTSAILIQGEAKPGISLTWMATHALGTLTGENLSQLVVSTATLTGSHTQAHAWNLKLLFGPITQRRLTVAVTAVRASFTWDESTSIHFEKRLGVPSP